MTHPVFTASLDASISWLLSYSEQIAGVNHQGLKGQYREYAISKVLSDLLPSMWHLGAGEIVDSKGKTSKETDLVVYRDDQVPPILLAPSHGVFPVESCAYAFEIKTTSDVSEVRDAIGKFRQLDELISLIGGRRPVRVYFAYGTDLTASSEFERYSREDPEYLTNPAFDVICVLGHGYWCVNRLFIKGHLREVSWHFSRASAGDHFGIRRFLSDIVNNLSELAAFGHYVMEDLSPSIVAYHDHGSGLMVSFPDSERLFQAVRDAHTDVDASMKTIASIIPQAAQRSNFLLRHLAEAYRDAQDEVVIEFASEALRLEPSLRYNAGLFHKRGLSHVRLYRKPHLEQAITDLMTAAELNPYEADIWYSLGVAHFERASHRTFSHKRVDFTEAIRCLKKAIEINPKDIDALLKLGACYTNSSAPQQAIETFHRIIGIDPMNADAMRSLAFAKSNLAIQKKGHPGDIARDVLHGNFVNQSVSAKQKAIDSEIGEQEVDK